MIISLILLISFLSFLFKIDILLSVYLSSLAIPLLSKVANKKTQNFKNRANPWPNFPKIQTLRKFSKKTNSTRSSQALSYHSVCCIFQPAQKKANFWKIKTNIFSSTKFSKFFKHYQQILKNQNRADPWPNFLKNRHLENFWILNPKKITKNKTKLCPIFLF